MKKYTKDELKELGLPASLIERSAHDGDITTGRHRASGARIYRNLYSVWSIVYGNIRDQPSLDRFLELCQKRGFNLDAIPGLDKELEKRAREYALNYKGVQYSFPDLD